MRTVQLFLFRFLLLALLSSNIATAQTTTTVTPCRKANACTVFLWMNGILGGPDPSSWDQLVKNTYKTAYFNAHTNPPLDPTLVVFDDVFNHGGTDTSALALAATVGGDLLQSMAQLGLLAQHRVDLGDPDFISLLHSIELYSKAGYKVVLVGHSQGTLYMALAYQGIQDKAVGTYVPSI